MPPAARVEDGALREHVRSGALVVDTRPSEEFLAAHLEGAVSLPLGRSFLTWSGSVLDPSQDLVLLMSPDDVRTGAAVARDLALIGYDRVLGALPARDLESFAPRRLASIPYTPVSELASLPAGTTVIDVRSRSEWNEGHVPGAVHVPLPVLASRLAELRERQPIVTYCQSGARSATAASLLRAAGVAEVSSAEGGFDAWSRIGTDLAASGRSR